MVARGRDGRALLIADCAPTSMTCAGRAFFARSPSLAPRVAHRPQVAIVHGPVAIARQLAHTAVAVDPAADSQREGIHHGDRGGAMDRAVHADARRVERQEGALRDAQVFLRDV